MTPEEEIKLRQQLSELHNWPEKYLFKFIVPEDEEKRRQVEHLFGDKANIKSRLSSKGNYSAYSVTMIVKDVDEVIKIYRNAGDIEGLISL